MSMYPSIPNVSGYLSTVSAVNTFPRRPFQAFTTLEVKDPLPYYRHKYPFLSPKSVAPGPVAVHSAEKKHLPH